MTLSITWERKDGVLCVEFPDGYAGDLNVYADRRTMPELSKEEYCCLMEVPSWQITDRMDDQFYRKLMAAGCLFEELDAIKE